MLEDKRRNPASSFSLFSLDILLVRSPGRISIPASTGGDIIITGAAAATATATAAAAAAANSICSYHDHMDG